jgi:hypothetical protein
LGCFGSFRGGNGGNGGNNGADGAKGNSPGGGGGGKGKSGSKSGNGANGVVIITGATGAILPVNFGPLKIYQQSNGIELDWTSYTESNVDHFEIERSANGQSFNSIGQVAAAGNSTVRIEYNWMDVTPLRGVSFYRIKSVDIDGKITYSMIVKINTVKTTVSNVSIYPNPVKNSQLALQFTNIAKGNYSIEIFNSMGQKILQQQINIFGENSTQIISLPSSVKPGIYNLLVSGGNVKMNHSFVVQ